MPLESARQFVVAMREDRAFRYLVRAAANDESLTAVIRKNGFAFEWHHLVAAMACCMEEIEQGCGTESSKKTTTSTQRSYPHE
jgi:hypothetical protein